ncbi:group I intron-associated PD-(D/E)XK endonuclease [Haloarcula amylovorans]|uniref:group I intron-associated PD-(D/E)XK endonuclease n=1 Tax=Haloarcula amylovorans TaxID=2562280 RepID=UPI0010765BB3|nr:group I intron-associated PD-(D/E)XK endonuclease [Halomicroarcula amylolytica]
MQTHERGDATEAIVVAELKKRGIPVSIPFGDNQRYDAIVETPDANLLRVQIKTGWLNEGKINFHGKTQHTNSQGNTYQKYEDDVDYFVVYTPDLESLHVVGEHEFDSRMQLRVEAPKQSQASINWADEYRFEGRWPLEVSGATSNRD